MIKAPKTPLLAIMVAMALFSANTLAINSGTDLNLSAKAKAGAMGGAAYTLPQEASAAVFGNPATLSQFKGINMNFAASYINIASLETETETAAGSSGRSKSAADHYILPDIGMTFELAPDLIMGTGLELDAGLGTDFRDDTTGTLGLPVVVELVSFNANVAAAYQASDEWSLGGSITIGFGLAQLGTAGSLLPTSSVHDIAFGGSLGATYQLREGVMLSATYKSKVGYDFKNILKNAGSVPSGFQDMTVEQPSEVVVGAAFQNMLMANLLLEADVIWKNWADAATYKDTFEDQTLLAFGGQYQMGPLSLRAGYSWAEEILRKTPGNTLGGLDLSNLLGPDAPSSQDVGRLAQMALLPVVWQHTLTAGVGYRLSESVDINTYMAYAFAEDTSTAYTSPALAGAVQKTTVDYELMLGIGIAVSIP
ncbi:MAG: outer membrane protein transport protein [Bermanella sp.]